jgi:hypothetical protein
MSDTDKRLDEIRARHAHEVRWLCTFGAAGLHLTTSSFQSHDDRAFLLAEIEGLRAQNERLRARVEVLEKVRAAAQALIDVDGCDDPAEDCWWDWEKNCEVLSAALKEAKP